MTILLSVVLAATLAGAAPQDTAWGGDHVEMRLNIRGGTIEFDCAHGTLDEAVRPDARGRFSVKGTFTPERSGPSRDDEGPRPLKTTYSGTITGETMTLTVTIEGVSGPAQTYELVRGRRGNLRKCR